MVCAILVSSYFSFCVFKRPTAAVDSWRGGVKICPRGIARGGNENPENTSGISGALAYSVALRISVV
jgi:hypothetical protein